MAQNDSSDAVYIFIVVGTTVLVLGGITCLILGILLLVKTKINFRKSGKRSLNSTRYSRTGNTSIMMIKVDDEEDLDDEDNTNEELQLNEGTALSDNDETGEDDFTDEGLQPIGSQGSNFSLIENSPIFIHNTYVPNNESLDILKDTKRLGSVSTFKSSHRTLNAVIDDTFAAVEEAGNFLSSQQELRSIGISGLHQDPGMSTWHLVKFKHRVYS